MTNAEYQPAPSAARNTDLRKKIVVAICGGSLAVFCVFVGVSFLVSRNRMPLLTPENFAAARAKWNSVAPNDYAIATRVKGNQPATYKVRVVDGQVQEALRNDYPLRDQRTLSTWSVPGMFRTIESDLDHMARDGATPRRTGQLHLRAEFDPQWGYPRGYLRVEWGNANQVTWQVEHFEVGSRREPLAGSECAEQE